MSTATEIRVPAGWYPDPASSTAEGITTQRRWWSGLAWTEHVAPIEAPSSPAVSTEAIAQAAAYARATGYTAVGAAPVTVTPRESARRAETMSLHPGSASSAPTRSASSVPSAASNSPVSPANAETAGYEPFSDRQESESLATVEATSRGEGAERSIRVNTFSIWLMATMPITQALLAYAVFTSLPAESSAWTRALTLVLPFVLYAALAGQDTRLMALAGHLRTAPWITALLAPPVYLAVRAIRVNRTTGALPWPLFVWTLAQAAVVLVWWIVDPEAVYALLSLLG